MAEWDEEVVRKDIAAALPRSGYDDGSIAPVLIRLAWCAPPPRCHASWHSQPDARSRLLPQRTPARAPRDERLRLHHRHRTSPSRPRARAPVDLPSPS